MNTISRREVLQAMAAASAAPFVVGCAHTARDTAAARAPGIVPVIREVVPERFTSLPFESQQLGGLFAERMKINVDGRLLQIDEKKFLSGFTGREGSSDPINAWLGEHAGKFLDAATDALRYQDNPQLSALMSRVAKTLIASQGADGYLGTYQADARWTSWDVWVHKYNLIGLLSYYELTGDPAALTACRKVGDLLDRTFGEQAGQLDIVAVGEHVGMASASVLEPICTLYRFTGEPRYLRFAQYIVRAYDHPGGPRIVSSLLDHGSVYRTANGKAYEMMSNFNGILDLYRLTGEPKLLDAVLRAWEDIVENQVSLTGSVSAMEHFQPRDRLLSLQASNVGETCATVTWLQVNWRLLRLTGEARFAHEIEKSVYNHLLAAQDRRNGDICYYTSFAGNKEFNEAVLCCVSSGPRGLSLIPKLAWGLAGDAFVVLLYTPGRASFEIEGVPVRVLSETAFPLDGAVTLTVSAAREANFTLRLRVPQWATRFEVKVGNRKLAGKAGQMLDVTQTWPASSTVRIDMDLPARALEGGPAYPDYLAVQRGPQVLALEKSINPGIPYLQRVGLPDSTRTLNLRATSLPSNWFANQVYEMEAVAGVSNGADELRMEKHAVALVPFADAEDYRVWVSREDRLRSDTPSVIAFSRGLVSNAAAGQGIAEYLTDENPQNSCIADPRDPPTSALRGNSRAKRGDPVWFLVYLEEPKVISRIAFSHGPLSQGGGWFDSSAGKPYIEVARAPVPVWDNIAWLRQPNEAQWEKVAQFNAYPMTNASTPPQLAEGQRFELRLPQAMMVYAIRLVGRPAGDYASCAELNAYA
jgi:DUF1680 family protein